MKNSKSLIVAFALLASFALFYFHFADDGPVKQPSETKADGGVYHHSQPGSGNSKQTSSALNDSAVKWLAASSPSGAFASMDVSYFASLPDPIKGHPAFVEASKIIDCQDLKSSGDEVYAAMGDVSQSKDRNVENFQFFHEVKKMRCKGVDIKKIGAVDNLMQEAANAGDVGAKTYLNLKILSADFAISQNSDGAQLSPPTPEMINAAEQLMDAAQSGNLRALGQAALLTATDRYGLYDPVASNAWQLIYVKSSLGSDFDDRKILDNVEPILSDQQKVATLALAKSLFTSCCAKK